MFPLAIAVFLGLIHLFAGKLRFLDVVPRSRWLSFAGGISVAYVFMHLLPELEESRRILGDDDAGAASFLENQAYLVALFGLAFFYGIERSTKQSHRDARKEREQDIPVVKIFWIAIASFACYNAVIGYLLVSRNRTGESGLLFFSLAMALHFVVNDYGLHAHHKDLYRRYGRWLLSVAVVIGAITALLIQVPESVVAILVSFLAGGIVLNVLKEELPEERESRFSSFLLGVMIYSGLLIAS